MKYIYEKSGGYQVILPGKSATTKNYVGRATKIEDAIKLRDAELNKLGLPIPKENRMPKGIYKRGEKYEARVQTFPLIDGVRKNKTVYLGLHDTVDIAQEVRENYLRTHKQK